MRKWMPGTVVAAAGACALTLVAPCAHAFQVTQDRIGSGIDTPRIELELRAHEQRMLRSQEEHRLNLRIDRETTRYRQEELRIPRIGQNCRLRLHGNNWLKTCR